MREPERAMEMRPFAPTWELRPELLAEYQISQAPLAWQYLDAAYPSEPVDLGDFGDISELI